MARGGSEVREQWNDPAAQHPSVLARGILDGDNDGYDYRRDTREGVAAAAMARGYQALAMELNDLHGEILRARALDRAFHKFNRGYTCPKCGHLLITEQHVESLR